MGKLVISHYSLQSWPLFSRPAHTTTSPPVSSPLRSPLSKLNLPIPPTLRTKDNSQKFSTSRALSPFPSISSTLSSTKIIKPPKGGFFPFTLDLTQAEFSRQEHSWYDHDDLIYQHHACSHRLGLIRLLDDTFAGQNHRDLNFRNSLNVFLSNYPTHFLPFTYSLWFISLFLHVLEYSVQTSQPMCFLVYVLSHIPLHESRSKLWFINDYL